MLCYSVSSIRWPTVHTATDSHNWTRLHPTQPVDGPDHPCPTLGCVHLSVEVNRLTRGKLQDAERTSRRRLTVSPRQSTCRLGHETVASFPDSLLLHWKVSATRRHWTTFTSHTLYVEIENFMKFLQRESFTERVSTFVMKFLKISQMWNKKNRLLFMLLLHSITTAQLVSWKVKKIRSLTGTLFESYGVSLAIIWDHIISQPDTSEYTQPIGDWPAIYRDDTHGAFFSHPFSHSASVLLGVWVHFLTI